MTLHLARVQPGEEAEAWLDARLEELKGGDPLAPVTVVTPNGYAGLALRRRLAARGTANVRSLPLARLAEQAGAISLARAGRLPAGGPVEEAAVRRAVLEAGGLGDQSGHRAVVQTVRSLFRDIDAVALGEGELKAIAGRGPLARLAVEAYGRYRALLAAAGLYDSSDLYVAARGFDPGLLEEWGPVVVFLPSRLGAPELAFLRVLGEAGHVEVALPRFSDNLADREPDSWEVALSGSPPPASAGGSRDGGPAIDVLMAPDATEEVRAAVRQVLKALEEGVRLDRIALVYASPEPYRSLVRETLDAARLEQHADLDGSPVAESWAGRGLLGLLHLQGEGFTRSAVLAWLSSLPHSEGPSLAQWDRISRDAGVVRGVGHWRGRLAAKIGGDQATLDDLERENDDASAARRAFLRSEIEAARRMAAQVEAINELTRPPRTESWSELCAWARRLLERAASGALSWPKAQREAVQLAEEVIDSLASAEQIEPATSVEAFVDALDAALRARRQPSGRLGSGVVTGPVEKVAGMRFERLFVLGMTERSFPSSPPADPILQWEGDHQADPLERSARRLGAERRAYLGALAGAHRVTLCFPRHDTELRPAYPAPWLLDAVATLNHGDRMGPAELRELGESPERPWLTSIPSALAPLARRNGNLNLAERRAAEAFEVVRAGGALRHAALARRGDLPLGHALAAIQARAGDRFSAFDGNLDAVARRLGLLEGGVARVHAISPTGVEHYAACPFRYFLERVLEVSPTNRPEDQEEWSISPIDRGSLIHSILDDFGKRLAAEGRPGPGEPYGEGDFDLLETVATQHFEDVERRGQTGHRLAWLNERSAILVDLRELLERDGEFRAGQRLQPKHFEQRFGFTEGWSPAEVELADGTRVRLRGVIDRIDEAEELVYITDYKTGTALSPQAFQEDPVVAGTRLQLAVYSNAVRRHLAERGEAGKNVVAAYWFVSVKGQFRRVEVADPEGADARLKEILEVVNDGLLAGAFPQVPGEEDGGWGRRPAWSNCRFCDYHRICPTNRDQLYERKRTSEGAAIHGRLSGEVGGV